MLSFRKQSVESLFFGQLRQADVMFCFPALLFEQFQLFASVLYAFLQFGLLLLVLAHGLVR